MQDTCVAGGAEHTSLPSLISSLPCTVTLACTHLDGGGESTQGPTSLDQHRHSNEDSWHSFTESCNHQGWKDPQCHQSQPLTNPSMTTKLQHQCHIQSLNIVPVNINFQSY